jgi:hypothetical protein
MNEVQPKLTKHINIPDIIIGLIIVVFITFMITTYLALHCPESDTHLNNIYFMVLQDVFVPLGTLALAFAFFYQIKTAGVEYLERRRALFEIFISRLNSYINYCDKIIDKKESDDRTGNKNTAVSDAEKFKKAVLIDIYANEVVKKGHSVSMSSESAETLKKALKELTPDEL